MTLVYSIIVMTLLCGFVGFGVDWGRVQMVKTQLERAAFAAARAGAAGVGDGTYSTKAIAMAANNTVDGSPLVLQAGDVVLGTWTAGSGFSAGGASPNAVRVNAYRTAARGTAVPLVFGKMAGMNTCDVKITNVVATVGGSTATGFTGLNSFGVHKKSYIASYNSGVSSNPTHASSNNNGIMQTNGVLGAGATAGGHLWGNATLGSSGSVGGGFTVHGTTTTNGSPITAPAVTMQVVSNPGGLPSSATVPDGTVFNVPGGTYYLTALTIGNSCTISFSSPTVIYMNGNLSMGDNNTLTGYNNIPANLVIYQSAGHTFIAHNTDTFIGVYNGPGSDVTFNDASQIQGSIMAKSISLHDNCDAYYDEALGTGTGGGTIGMGK